jgi:hypothetical protein
MPVPGTNSYPWRYQWSRSRSVRYGSNERQRDSHDSWSRRHRVLEGIMTNLGRDSSSFTLRDTTCHEDVKYVLKLDSKTVMNRVDLFVLCIVVLDCYE